jgi:hypothetical protein
MRILHSFLLAFALALLPSVALAQTPTPTPIYGGCFNGGVLCAGPSASIIVAKFNLADSTFTGGVNPGVGYGLTWTPPSAPWAAVGVDLYASLQLGSSVPNNVAFSFMGHFANYIFLGIGPTITQRTGQSALTQWSILGGLGIPIDLNAYQAQSKAALDKRVAWSDDEPLS